MPDPNPSGVATVDARGLRCPWPVLRLARAARGGAGVVELLSDDPAAASEVAAFAAERGWRLDATPGRFVVTIG